MRRRFTSALFLIAAVLLLARPAGAVVSTTGVSVSYAGDGYTTAFAYPDYLFEAPDLIVTSTICGVTTNYPQGAQPGFTFAGTTDCYGSFPSGGTVNVVDGSGNPLAPAAAANILITRLTPKTQPVHFVDNNPLSACVLEHGYDKLTLMAQEVSAFQGMANGPPVTGSLSMACAYLGEWFENGAVSAGANFGWVCTTAGIAGTAVWSPFGAVSL